MGGRFWLGVCLLAFSACGVGASDDILDPGFDDAPLEEPIENPDWFKLSFLDIADDVREAAAGGKRGLVVYFGQKYCPYCKALLEVNFGKPDIVTYTRMHFDVVGIDTRGSRLVTDLDGTVLTEKAYAERHDATFTPTLVFYAPDGEEVLRLVGYHPPYEFRAALEYVADAHYRREDFRHYLARAGDAEHGPRGLNRRAFFAPPPHALDRSRFAAQRPLVVFFEQAECHACDVLHTGALGRPAALERLARFEAVQLDMWADTPVVTPDGTRTTARAWADRLGLFYAPTLVFFDEHGREILRIGSVVHFHRLQAVLRYVLEEGYRRYPSFQAWREQADPSAP